MFIVITKVFVALLNLSGSLIYVAKVYELTKYISPNKEPYLATPTCIDSN